MILSLTSLNGTVCSMVLSSSSISTGVIPSNASRKRTCERDHAAFSLRSLFGQEIDVVVVGVGGLVEPVQPLVDVANGRVNLAVARRGGHRRERLVERFFEPVARGQRPGHAEARAR